MSDDKAKPAKPVLPFVDVDVKRDFLVHSAPQADGASSLIFITDHHMPENIPEKLIELPLDIAGTHLPLKGILPRHPSLRGHDDKLMHYDKGPADSWLDFIYRGSDGLPTKSLVMYGSLHHAPDKERITRLFMQIKLRHQSEENQPPFDKGPAESLRDLVVFHEEGHLLHEGTKFIPTLNPEFLQDIKFSKLTAEFEAKYKRIDQASAMLAFPTNEIEVAQAECRVTFGQNATIVDKRQHGVGAWGQPANSVEVYARIMSPTLANNPLEAATAVAIIRGDASPMRSKYNIEI